MKFSILNGVYKFILYFLERSKLLNMVILGLRTLQPGKNVIRGKRSVSKCSLRIITGDVANQDGSISPSQRPWAMFTTLVLLYDIT